MINILVVEDSENDLFLYKNVFKKFDKIKLNYAKSGEEALTIAKQHAIDIFILDIELPGISGLELASKIRSFPHYALTLILFITGYEENQLNAFKQFHCYDYILKPFNAAEFEKKFSVLLQQLSLTRPKIKKDKLLLFPMKNREILIPITQIKYAEVLHRRCYLYTDLQEAPFESSSITLKELISEINDAFFVQCHKAFAVNIKKIQEIEQLNYRLWRITLHNDKNQLYVSKTFYVSIEELLKKWILEGGEK